MKITVVSHDCFWPLKGGGGIKVYWVVKTLLKKGHNVTVIAPTESHDFEEEFTGIKFLSLGSVSRFKGRKEIAYTKMALKVFKYRKAFEADIIYAHSSIVGFPAMIISKMKKVPMVFDMDDLLLGFSDNKLISKYGVKIEYLIARNSKAVNAMSKALGEEIKKRGAREVVNIPHGVNFDIFKPMKAKKKDWIIYIGGIESHDGIDLIVKAAPKILLNFPEIKFVIIGEGKRKKEIIGVVKENKLQGSFIFKSWVDQKEIPKYLAQSLIGVIPHKKSLAVEVSQCLKVFEYMAMELPVVGTDVAGTREQLTGATVPDRGLLFESNNAIDLADKILHLLNRPLKRAFIGKEARRYVLKNNDWNKNAKKIVKLCEDNALRT